MKAWRAEGLAPIPELHGHAHVLFDVEGPQQIVALEDVADAPTHSDQDLLTGTPQLFSQDAEASLLDCAQCTHQGQQSRLSRTGGPRQDQDLALVDARRDIEEDLLSQSAASIEIAIVLDLDGHAGRHQKISAGWAERSFRIASPAELQHMNSVRPNTTAARATVISIGRFVAAPACA